MTKRVLFLVTFSFSWVLQFRVDSDAFILSVLICLIRSFGFVHAVWALLEIGLASARRQSKICRYNLHSFVDWGLFGLFDEFPVDFGFGFQVAPNGGAYIPLENGVVGFIRSWVALVHHCRWWSPMTVASRHEALGTCKFSHTSKFSIRYMC